MRGSTRGRCIPVDVDFDDASGRKSLMSLKHKAVGVRIPIWTGHHSDN